MNRLIVVAAAFGFAAAAAFTPSVLALAGAGQGSARETPAAARLISPRHDCELFLPVNVTNHIYAADPDLKVTINNGNVSRDVVIQLSAEGATSDRSTTVGVRYSIDGASFYVYGPELLVADTTVETRTNLSIVALGPGSHTIVPGYVIYYGQGTGQLLFRCLSVESGPRQA